jgi:hypothetical protein
VNATVLTEKQEVRRKPNADCDGFIITCTGIDFDNVSVFILSWVVIYELESGVILLLFVVSLWKISKEEF